jgi:carboxylate-amine ligase
MRPEPAADVVRALIGHVSDALEDSGDVRRVREAAAALGETGNGARFQRELMSRTGNLRDVVAACVRRTSGG